MIKLLATLIKFLTNLFRGPSYIVGITPSPGQDHRRFALETAKTATQDNAPPQPAWDLWDLRWRFRAASNATVVYGDQPGSSNVSFPFNGLNDEELQIISRRRNSSRRIITKAPFLFNRHSTCSVNPFLTSISR